MAKSLHEPRTASNLLVLPCCCCCCHHLHCCLSLSLSVLGVGRFSYYPPPCLGMYRWMHLSLGCMSFECRITMPSLAWLIFSLQHLNQPSHSTATDWLNVVIVNNLEHAWNLLQPVSKSLVHEWVWTIWTMLESSSRRLEAIASTWWALWD